MKHRFCLFLPLILFVTVPNNTFARDWLQPLPTKGNQPFVLEEFRFVPYRFTYKGFSAENSNIRYLLKTEDGRLFSLHLGETIDGVTLSGADALHKTVTVRDDRLGQTLTLELGKETLLPNRFEGSLRYKDKHYSFSKQPLRLDEQTQLTPMLYEGRLYLLQQTEGKEPCIWELQMP
jgi:hypothetical protein